MGQKLTATKSAHASSPETKENKDPDLERGKDPVTQHEVYVKNLSSLPVADLQAVNLLCIFLVMSIGPLLSVTSAPRWAVLLIWNLSWVVLAIIFVLPLAILCWKSL
jgi:hypothetical protein